MANFKHLKSEKLKEMIGTGWDHIAKKSLWDYLTFKIETVLSKGQTSPDKFSNSSSERHSTNLKIGSAASSNNSNATNAVLQLAQQASLAAAALAFQQPKVLRYY